MVKVIGLTGGIGTGKSTAAAYLKKKGFHHIDADEISRDITADGSGMLKELDMVFGPEGKFGDGKTRILDDKGSLDRRALASLVFTDRRKKAVLDKIMFRAIIKRIDEEICKFRDINDEKVYILLDAPLLFEAGLDSRCDKIIVLVADEEVRIERVCRRDGVTAREVRDRINSQMSDSEKIKKSDFVVDNSDGMEQLAENLDELLEIIF